MSGSSGHGHGPDYGRIAASYAYFLTQSTETVAQIAALAPVIAAHGGLTRLLDYGCGDGAFLARLLERAGVPAGLAVTLVEPAMGPRAGAIARLQAMPGVDVSAASGLGEGSAAAFDLIVANHSLYYVPDLVGTVAALCARRAEGGTIVAALLDRANALARIWVEGYAAIAEPFPFALAEDVAAALGAHGLAPRRTRIAYRIDVPDSPRAREHLVRFLFGPELAARNGERLGRPFDRYRHGERIVIETSYPQLVADGSGG